MVYRQFQYAIIYYIVLLCPLFWNTLTAHSSGVSLDKISIGRSLQEVIAVYYQPLIRRGGGWSAPEMRSLPVWQRVPLLLLLVTSCCCLELREVLVPRLAELHRPARLSCRFGLGGHRLHSVRWYKDGEEFFRFSPAGRPNLRTFPVPGAHVLLDKSDFETVTLKNVSQVSAGIYTCEVSSDMPHFIAVHVRSKMDVYSLPDRFPEIEIEKKSLFSGEKINASCSSGKSRPKQTLNWFLNGIQVNSSFIVFERIAVTGSGLFRSYSNISLTVFGSPGPLLLSCVSSMDPLLPNYKAQVDLFKGQRDSEHHVESFTGSHLRDDGKYQFGYTLQIITLFLIYIGFYLTYYAVCM